MGSHGAAAWCSLVLVLMLWQNSVRDVSGVNPYAPPLEDKSPSSSDVLLALSYPSVRIGPYNWRYFRVEVPRAFSKLSITLTRKWTGEHIGDHNTKVPLVCFRHEAPPLPDTALESPQAAAMAAGKTHNVSETGKCAWFYSNSSVALTNTQIVAGVWYVGVFSDSLPSRFQSKMISRGSVYSFGVQFTVLGCKSPTLGGRHCNITITQLCLQSAAISSQNSGHSPGHSQEPILQQSAESAGTSGLSGGVQDPSENIEKRPAGELQNKEETLVRISLPSMVGNTEEERGIFNRPMRSGEESWTSLPLQSVGPGAWRYFALEVAYFAAILEVRAACASPNCGQTSPQNGTGEAGGHFLKYGSPPEEGDEACVMGATATVPAPRRGQWYIGVLNSNMTVPLEFTLYWRVESCSSGTAGERCGWAMNSLERVLVEDAYESPFDSYYSPAGEGGSLHSPWFPLLPLTGVATTPSGNSSSGNWTYFFIEVPRGAAGAVLSVELRHVGRAAVAVYTRFEAFPSLENWDSYMPMRAAVERKRGKSSTLSLNLVYPAEGFWCVGVHHVHQAVSSHETTLESTPYRLGIFRQITSKSSQLWRDVSRAFVQWCQSTTNWVRVSLMKMHREDRALRFGTAEDCEQTSCSRQRWSGIAPARQPLEKLASERREPEMEMHISVHGCVNRCSGRGKCRTGYESSRLHYYSYCHCDEAHGGIDCSVPLVVPVEEAVHIWALIGSNFAAILPSLWAMRHHAYSEWVAYTASGVASGFYHSCDAGGWCALSYDTLQFLDFWLAFLVVVMTCLYIASFKHTVKAVAHIGAAIVTAAVTKENATSAWNVLLVVLIGTGGLVLGWAWECWRLHLIPSWIRALGPIRRVIRVESVYRRSQQFMNHLKGRFRWFYLTTGLGILLAAAMSWVLETDDTYWIWHSLWHVSIYTSVFMILCSTAKTPWASDADSGRYGPMLQQPTDPDTPPVLRHTVELDAFASEDDRLLDD